MINCFLYSVYGQGGGSRHIDDPDITLYRNRWIDAAVTRNDIEAIVTLGGLAKTGVDQWKLTDRGKASTIPVIPIIHPTYPDSASASGTISKPDAFKKLCTDWNAALVKLAKLVTADDPRPLKKYGDTITDEEKIVIPAIDLPAGLPRFMLDSPKTWASRTGTTVDQKRGSITVTVPNGFRDWPVLPVKKAGAKKATTSKAVTGGATGTRTRSATKKQAGRVRRRIEEPDMSYAVDFVNVSTVGLESSPVAAALAGLRANEARYFKNKYDHVFTVEPAAKAKKAIDWVHRILKEERDIVIASPPLEATTFEVENIRWTYVFYESGLSINVLYQLDEPKKRAVGFKLSEGMEVPAELGSFKFARQKSKLAGTIRGSYFVIKGEY